MQIFGYSWVTLFHAKDDDGIRQQEPGAALSYNEILFLFYFEGPCAHILNLKTRPTLTESKHAKLIRKFD